MAGAHGVGSRRSPERASRRPHRGQPGTPQWDEHRAGGLCRESLVQKQTNHHAAKPSSHPEEQLPGRRRAPDRRLQGGLTGSEHRQGPGRQCRHRTQSGLSGTGRPATVTAPETVREKSRAEFSSTDSSAGHFPGNRQLRGGADSLRRSPGPETPPAAPLPRKGPAWAGAGQGASRRAGGCAMPRPLPQLQGRRAWPWGRLDSKPQQLSFTVTAGVGGGETGCLAATSPRPSRALGGTTWLLRAKSSVWRWGQGTCPPHTPPVPVQPPVPPCPRPGPGVTASLSHQLMAAGGCECSLEGDAHSTHAGTHATRQVEGTQGGPRTPSLWEARQDWEGGRDSQGGGRAILKHKRFDPWLGNSHAARKNK